MDRKKLRSADILSGIIFIVIGIVICAYSVVLMMDNRDASHGFYASAGFVPFVFGVLLIVTSACVLWNGIKEGGSLKLFRIKTIMDAIKSENGIITIFVYGWTAIYIFILLKILPYFIATFIYLLIFMYRFYSKKPVLILAISVIISLLVTFMFGTVVNIPLPGM